MALILLDPIYCIPRQCNQSDVIVNMKYKQKGKPKIIIGWRYAENYHINSLLQSIGMGGLPTGALAVTNSVGLLGLLAPALFNA